MKRAAPPAWHVYFVRTKAGALYAGIATDVPRRLAEHEAGRGSRYLRGRGPLTLAFSRRVGDHSLALRIESRLKRQPKAEKEAIALARPPKRALLRQLGLIEAVRTRRAVRAAR